MGLGATTRKLQLVPDLFIVVVGQLRPRYAVLAAQGQRRPRHLTMDDAHGGGRGTQLPRGQTENSSAAHGDAQGGSGTQLPSG